MAGKGYVFIKNSQVLFISAIFTSTCHKKLLNSWPNLSNSHVMNRSQLSACQGKMGPFKSLLSTCGHQTIVERDLSKSRLFNFWQYYRHVLSVH